MTSDRHNPYATPHEVSTAGPDFAYVRIRAVARVFSIIGWFGVIVYTPIVIMTVGSLFGAAIAFNGTPLPVLAVVSLLNIAVLALAVLFMTTGRRISRGDFRVKRRAILLSCLLVFGIPVFSIVGIICLRYLHRYFNEEAAPMLRIP